MKNKFLDVAGFLLLQFYIFPKMLAAQTFPVNQVVINGDSDKRINIVFMSEGYTDSQLGQFNQNVQTAIQDLFNTPPYREYRSYFNVYSIEVPSNQSGADHPGAAVDEPPGLPTFVKNTYFNSTFDFAGIHRLLVPDYTISNTVLMNNFPEWDIVFLLVNHDWYGGSGGIPASFSLNSASSEIAVHELGHSFASLVDEYETGGLPAYEGPNATAETVRERIRWNLWIEDTTPLPTPETGDYADVVGLFEGAAYQSLGWYRPKLNCKMRALGVDFCEVCTEQIILSIYNLLNTVESYEPVESALTLMPTSVQDFGIRKMAPDPNALKTEWYLNGALVRRNTDSFTFDASLFSTDNHVLQVLVTDTTDMVRNDPDSLTHTKIAWQITIDRSAVSVEDQIESPEEFMLYQNYPNPFNPVTDIRYQIPQAIEVDLAIYNQLGQKVITLINEKIPAGTHRTRWDGRDETGIQVASGVYLCRLEAGLLIRTRKMILLR